VAITITREGELFHLALTGPDGPWESAELLTPTEVLAELSARGVHSTDATDLLDATGADWRPIHDAEVLRRRASERESD
jgi:hypothetical protein